MEVFYKEKNPHLGGQKEKKIHLWVEKGKKKKKNQHIETWYTETIIQIPSSKSTKKKKKICTVVDKKTKITLEP